MIKKFKNIHLGERVFIIGNGPSLEKTDLEKLNNEFTIATNKIYKIFGDTKWRPTYYTLTTLADSVNQTGVENIASSDGVCFINSWREEAFLENDNIFPLSVWHPPNDPRDECLNDPEVPKKSIEYWSDNLHKYIYLYNSSIYPLYQVANYMGFDKIYLIGCDLGMDVERKLFSDGSDPFEFTMNSSYNSTIKMYYDYIKYSDKKIKSLMNGIYAKFSDLSPYPLIAHNPNFSGYNPKMMIIGEDDRQRRAHKLAKKKLTERGVDVYNATLGGELEIFKRVDFYSIV